MIFTTELSLVWAFLGGWLEHWDTKRCIARRNEVTPACPAPTVMLPAEESLCIFPTVPLEPRLCEDAAKKSGFSCRKKLS